jgi:hypothetical protein
MQAVSLSFVPRFVLLNCFVLFLFQQQISVRAMRGCRQYMEDEYFVGSGGRFAAIFDGHGR